MAKQGRFETKAPAPEKQKPSRKKNTGSRLLLSLISSVVSLMLCCTMFLGTTMAWFTDTVTSAGNQITIGTLEMGVKFGGQSLETDPRTRAVAPQIFDNSFHWRPNRFEARALTLENSGSLDIKYVLNLLIDSDDASVAKYFDVYVYTGTGEVPTGTLDEDSRGGWDKVGNLAEMYKGGINVLEGELKAGVGTTYETIGFALHMRADVGDNNEELAKIFGQTMSISIKLNAYQIDTPEEKTGTTAIAEAAAEPEEDDAADKASSDDTDEEPPASSTPEESSQPTDGSEPTDGSQPTDGSEPTEGSQPTEGSEPTEGSQPTEGSEPTEGSQPTDGSEPTEGSQPTDGSEPTDGSIPTESSEPSGGDNAES